jgi:hypothetical protein
MVLRLIRDAMANRVKRTRETTERIMACLAAGRCCVSGCTKPVDTNGNCTEHDNKHRHLIGQITIDDGPEEARKVESRIMARGDRLAPGETVQFKRELRLREAEARSASAANAAKVG